MAYRNKGLPFTFKGVTAVEDCKTSLEVMNKAGLNWEVEKCEMAGIIPANIEDYLRTDGFVKDDYFYKSCPNAYATYRTDTNTPLGIVKHKYTPVQNSDAFKFFDNAIGKDKAIWFTAGMYGNGEKVFVSAKLPDNILVNGDPVDNYLVFTNAHDGTSGVKILLTPIRVVCTNMLNAAVRNASNYVSFRHTQSVHSKINQAAELLGICKQKINYLSEVYNQMAKTKMSDKEAQDVFAKTVLTETEYDNIKNTGHTVEQIIVRNFEAISDANISTKKVNIISEMNTYYHTGIGQREIQGTAWGVYGAVTGYYSNVDNAEGIKRMDSILYGDKSRKIEFAGNIII